MDGTKSSRTPVWFLDVDGVLNSWDAPGRKHPGYERLNVNVDGTDYPITYSPAVVARVAALHHSGAVRLVWLTTWLDAAAAHLAPALGLPAMDVLARDATLQEGPTRTGMWWKQAAVNAAVDAAPDRPFVWTDDDLTRHVKDAVRARFPSTPAKMLTTMRTPGLTLDNVEQIEQFLTRVGPPTH